MGHSTLVVGRMVRDMVKEFQKITRFVLQEVELVQFLKFNLHFRTLLWRLNTLMVADYRHG